MHNQLYLHDMAALFATVINTTFSACIEPCQSSSGFLTGHGSIAVYDDRFAANAAMTKP